MHYYCIIHASLLFVKSLMCKFNIQHTYLTWKHRISRSCNFYVWCILLNLHIYQKKPSSLVVHFIVRTRDIYKSGRTNVCCSLVLVYFPYVLYTTVNTDRDFVASWLSSPSDWLFREEENHENNANALLRSLHAVKWHSATYYCYNNTQKRKNKKNVVKIPTWSVCHTWIGIILHIKLHNIVILYCISIIYVVRLPPSCIFCNFPLSEKSIEYNNNNTFHMVHQSVYHVD